MSPFDAAGRVAEKATASTTVVGGWVDRAFTGVSSRAWSATLGPLGAPPGHVMCYAGRFPCREAKAIGDVAISAVEPYVAQRARR